MMKELSQGQLTPVLVCALVAAICLCLGIYRVRSSRRHAALLGLARKRGRQVSQSLRMFRMAEEIAGLGMWQYFPKNDKQKWSRGMKLLFGMEADEKIVPGDMETLLTANGIDLVKQVTDAAETQVDLTEQFRIHRLDGQHRVLNVRATPRRNRKGRISSFTAVLMDVTDQTQKVNELEHSRQAAVKEAKKAHHLAETDPLTGIANRRRVMANLDRLVMRARAITRSHW